jgi:hypothetical protein
MEIKPNSSFGPVPVGETPPTHRPRRTEGDAGEFRGTEALQRALAQTPDVRPEAVARGQALAASDEYPPQEVVRRLAAMLATEFTRAAGVGSPAAGANATPEPPQAS